MKMMNLRQTTLIAALGCLLCAPLSMQAQDEEYNPVLLAGIRYLDTPYVAHTLEGNPTEELVVNCDEVDCTTFVEYVLAESLCPRMANGDISETTFGEYLQKIRYRNGEIKGYTSRLHYIAEWINNGVKQGFIEDVTATHGRQTQQLKLSYMTDHPEQYAQLAKSPADVATMKQIEKALSGYEYHYVAQEALPSRGLSWIKNGDIIAITTSTPGLDVAHLGIAMYVDGKLALLHASSKEKKVVVSSVTLSQMLKGNPSWTGIRVLRMKPQQ